jgi:hypothetical protein
MALTLAFAACGPTSSTGPSSSPPASPGASSTPVPSPSGSPAPSGDNAAIYDSIEADVREIRGLQPKRPVEPTVVSSKEMEDYTTRTFHEDNPADYIAASDALAKGMGLLDDGTSLEDAYLKLLGSQVAGLYSPDDKKLYVVSKSGALGPTERVTFAHEYTHALQDQNFDLQSLGLDQLDQGDRNLARLALVEGDATLLMGLWAQSKLSLPEQAQMLRDSMDPEANKILQESPRFLVDGLLFPYTSGLGFVQGLYAQGGFDAVNAAFRDLPASTEQILHPDKYRAGEAPVQVALPADLAAKMGSGWKVGLQDTFGESQLATWLRETGVGADATAAAAGWGGDRVALLEGPNGAWAIVLRTAWDTERDATEFDEAAQSAERQVGGVGEHFRSGREVWIVIGSDAEIAAKAAAAAGQSGG